MLYASERQRPVFDCELITVKCSLKTSVSLVLRKCSHKSDIVIVTSFVRTPLHTSLCPFGVRIRQVRLLYLNSPNYSSLLHADQCKHYNTTVVISVGVIKCVCPYTIHILLGKKGLYPLLLLGISSFCSIFSFAFPIQTTWCSPGNFCLFINYADICSWIHVQKNQHVFWDEKTKHICKLKKSVA